MSESKIPSVLAGVAGEYFVAAELSRRGWIASITLRNTRGIDLLVTNASASRSVTIQCKTRQVKAKKWLLNEKCETFYSKNHFYVFVGLGGATERPDYHIVPSTIVAKQIKREHEQWRNTPGRQGQQHKPTTMRNFYDKQDKYLERWDLLGL
jgi:hypothetical protein